MGWHLLPLLIGTAFAYPTPVDFDGSLMRWDLDRDSLPVTYEVKADNESFSANYGAIVDDAAGMWSDIQTSYFHYSPVEGAAKAMVTLNLKSAIDGGDFSAGYAIFDAYDGQKPKHCSIFIVVDEYVSYQGMQKTILHELGHCVGLGHTLIPEAIMSYRLEENSYALDVDDRAAVSRLYPADGSRPQVAPGCAVGATRGEAPALPLLVLLALPLALAAGLYIRRRVERQDVGALVEDA